MKRVPPIPQSLIHDDESRARFFKPRFLLCGVKFFP
jgi:hypothetical protein